MIYGLYQSAAGMMTGEYRQAVIANNLANAETSGFKRELAVFSERLPAALAGVRDNPSKDSLAGLSGGMWLGHTHTDFSAGTLQRTDNPLDVALAGEGFLTVDGGGQPLLTRDGRMLMDAVGTLRSAVDGAAVLGPGGAPITLNPRGGQPFVDEQGRISQNSLVVGQLGIVDVANYAALRKVGAGRFAFDPDDQQPAAVRVQSGFVESSGVEAVQELVGMIESSRMYQLNAQMVSLQDQTAGRMIASVEA
jgi:flagellar basal body rod protein FlgG